MKSTEKIWLILFLFLCPFYLFSQIDPAPPAHIQAILHGTLIDSRTKTPVSDATIQIIGTTHRVISNTNGIFELSTGQKLPFEVKITCVGYKTIQVEVTHDNVVIPIAQSSNNLNDIVVIGYGTQKKTDVTGSVASLNTESFNKSAQSNALQMITGEAAGVQISQASSAPGGAINIKIRGANSINAGNSALVVIDGMVAADPSSLDPNDIKSIDILKDASASAIYGSRAANGVVIITTKKGAAGMQGINYNGYVGVQSVSKKLDVLNATQYMLMVDSVTAGNKLAQPYTSDQVASAGTGTDWQAEIYRTAMMQNHSLSFAGTSDKMNYYLGLNYFDQDGVVMTSNYKKYGVRFNSEFHPIEKLKMNLNFEAQKGINHPILATNAANESAGPINSAIEFDPSIQPGIDSSTGQYYTNPSIALNNPMSLLHGIQNTTTNNRAYGTLSAEYSILKNFTATLRFGYDQNLYRTDNYISRLTINGGATDGQASVSSYENYHWIAEYFMTYNGVLNNHHHITLLGGTTFEDTYSRNLSANASGFPSDLLGTDLLQSGLQSTYGVASSASDNRLNSFLGRLNYSYDDKYLLTASVRVDGSSVFSTQNQYATFPSVALGWRLINEPFLKGSKVLSDLKLRASYGTIGNQAIPNFQTLYTFVSSGTTVLNDAVVTGVEPARFPNPGLKWETTAETNIGLDFGFFNQRLSGSVEYYHKNTRDQLFNRPVVATTGFTTQYVNSGNVVNKGIDVLITSQNVDNDIFKWKTSLTVSTLKNVVTKLPDFIPQPIFGGTIGTFNSQYTIVNVGDPIDAFYGYKVTGVFQQNDNIAASAQPAAKPGDLKFFDKNGNGKIDAGDRMVLGSPFPKYTIGLSNNLSYKGFNLSFMINAVEGVSTLDVNTLESIYPINTYRNRYSNIWLNRWTPQNPTNKYPSLINPTSYGGALSVNSLDVVDASYIRLQNLTLSYSVPLKKKKGLKSLSVNISADNVVTLTKFKGYNPDANDSFVGNGSTLEKANYNSYPLSRIFRFGVNLAF